MKMLRRSLYELEGILKRVGITVALGSAFEGVCLNATSLVDQWKNASLRPAGDIDIRPFHRELVAISDLAAKILVASRLKGFSTLQPHLELLNTSAPTQNAASSILDQGNNKLFELFIACLCLGAGGSDVELDHPRNSDGKNPDVVATFEGVKWGFACKALHSDKGMIIFDNIKKAVEQIQASPVQRGIPIFNVRNVIAHNDFWPSFFS